MKQIVALKIGRAKYRVRYRRLLPENLGRLFFTTRTINVEETSHDYEVADTLLHEILHGVWDQQKLPDRAREERTVTALASGLAGVFRDNPGLLAHIETLVRAAR